MILDPALAALSLRLDDPRHEEPSCGELITFMIFGGVDHDEGCLGFGPKLRKPSKLPELRWGMKTSYFLTPERRLRLQQAIPNTRLGRLEVRPSLWPR